ncbi:lipopolysaccharide assembly protein LapB [Bradyrhizobium sp. ORS 285]|uniref:tetratricopeptide repeat protein n=1 Tax=Bradyrhizobium sp. ORS 285 TaxID=115808 RepID=UPI000312ED00|nr:hypothetical protein [Bradyrhizobium sp. ORS 285]
MAMRRWCLLAGQALIIGLIFNSSADAAPADAARCTSGSNVEARIAGCTAVMEQRRSAPPQVIKAHLARASAYFHRGDLDHAIDDYKWVIAHVSADPLAAYNRAPDLRAGEPLSLSSAEPVLRRDGDRARAYLGLGIASFQAGLLEQSQDEFKRLIAIEPGNAAAALWLDLARRRAGQASELASHAKRLDMRQWPAPLVRLFLGQETVDGVLAAADGSGSALRRTRRCEASFFAGELMLQQNREAEAIRLIDQALAGCPLGSDLRSVASAEARVLSVMP